MTDHEARVKRVVTVQDAQEILRRYGYGHHADALDVLIPEPPADDERETQDFVISFPHSLHTMLALAAGYRRVPMGFIVRDAVRDYLGRDQVTDKMINAAMSAYNEYRPEDGPGDAMRAALEAAEAARDAEGPRA